MNACIHCGATNVPHKVTKRGRECENVPACNRRRIKAQKEKP